jgi:hypothetical protein
MSVSARQIGRFPIGAGVRTLPVYFPRTDMATNAKSVVETGSRGAYRWLTTSRESLNPLLAACPQAVLNKYLAVTSLDSGSPMLNEHQRAAGWENRNGIAYSPKLQSVQDLPHATGTTNGTSSTRPRT